MPFEKKATDRSFLFLWKCQSFVKKYWDYKLSYWYTGLYGKITI